MISIFVKFLSSAKILRHRKQKYRWKEVIDIYLHLVEKMASSEIIVMFCDANYIYNVPVGAMITARQ